MPTRHIAPDRMTHHIAPNEGKSKSCGGVKIGECTVQRLLFADDLVLLDSTQNRLKQALDRFSKAYSVAGMKISTTKTETMCLSRQPKQCSLQIEEVPLKQSEKIKYLGVSFTSDGRQNNQWDIRIGKASAVMCQLHQSVVLRSFAPRQSYPLSDQSMFLF